jgi:hypothetical protein
MYWGIHGLKPWPRQRPRILGGREAVPAILQLFQEFGVHATWATVGFLFFATKAGLLQNLPARRPAYANRRLDPYAHLDEIGPDESHDPVHFGASLLETIARHPSQEIGTHTFSHYYCLEPGQDADSFRADLEAALAAAQRRSLTLRSIVFPCNQTRPEYLPICQALGLVAYRGNSAGVACQPTDLAGQASPPRRALRLLDSFLPVGRATSSAWPPPTNNGLVDVPASRYLRPFLKPLALLEPLRLARITSEMTSAARTGRIYHLWWHPHDFGLDLARNLRFLRRVLEHFRALHASCGLRSLNILEAATEARCFMVGGGISH